MGEYSDYIHWFSKESRISLELPFSFYEAEESSENSSAAYREDPEDVGGPGAVVVAKATGIPVGQTDGFRLLAEESAKVLPKGASFSHETITVDGIDAITQVFEYSDPDLGVAVQRRELFAQIGNVVFSITALVPQDRIEACRPGLDHAFKTARFVLLPEISQYAGSFSHDGTQTSIVIPEGWEAQEVSENQIRFFGPPEQAYNDYRPTFSITLGRPDGFGEEWMADFLEQARANMADSYRNFATISQGRIPLSSLAEAHTLRFSWEPEPDFAFVQTQAIIQVDRYRLYVINSATLAPLSEKWTPVFDQMLQSLRILGP